jgi:hypothetical protein
MPADQAPRTAPRPWLVVMLGVALVALVVYQLWPSATPPSGPSNRTRPPRSSQAPGQEDAGSLDVKLGALEKPPPEPSANGRNPFRFHEKAPPSPTQDARTRPTPVPPIEPPQPVGPPPIALKFFSLFDSGRSGKIAGLSDGRDVFYGREGDIIDGRYRIVKIGVESIVMEYTNGSGRRTIPLRGQ